MNDHVQRLYKVSSSDSLLKRTFTHFAYFYEHLGYRVIVTLLTSLLVGIFDGLGITMFLPMLQMINGDSTVDSTSLGNLSFILDGLENLGISLTLSTILILMVTFFSVKGMIGFFDRYYRVSVQCYFIRNLRFKNIELLTNLDYRSFVLSDAGKIQNTLSAEVERVNLAYRNYMETLQHTVLMSVYVSLAFIANPQFTVLISIGGVLINFLFRKFYLKTKRSSLAYTNEAHSFNGLLIQNISFFKYLQSTGLAKKFADKLIEAILRIEKNVRRMGLIDAFLVGLREPLVIIVVALVIYMQLNFLGGGLGLIILTLLLFYRALNALMLSQSTYNFFLSASGSLLNMQNFNQELTRHQFRNGDRKLDGFTDKISIKKISVEYQGKFVLRDISFDINKNETVAIVGPSGSGKTTLMNVLAGLITPDNGEVLVSGIPLAEVDRSTFQRRIGYITQEPVIFNDTVFNNVTFWDSPTAENKERFNEALRKAAMFDFVMQLPEKEHAQLGDNGVLVSGGQKQRLSIAREFYKEIQILFMDEATSALDSETERLIQHNIELAHGAVTIIVIAHRLSTVRSANKIILLNNGSVELSGDFEFLKRNSDMFKRMVELQGF